MDDVVFNINLCLLLGPFGIELLSLFLLLIQLDLLVINPTSERLDLWLDFSEFVFGYLEVSFRAKTHVCDLCQTCLVLLSDLYDLKLSVLSDLLHSLIVVPLHRLYVCAQVGDLLVFFRDSVLVFFLLLIHLLCVFLVDCSLSVSELSCLLLLLLLKGLVFSSSFKHILW